MTKIQAVLFDYGMVLSGPPDPAARAEMSRLLHAEDASLQAAYWRYRDAYDRGALRGVAYWEAVAGELDRPLDASTLEGLIAADNALWTQPNQAMIDWAVALQHAGIKTGVLSNIGDEMEAGIVAHFPWFADFAHCTFSHRLGMAKPDKAIYRHAAEGLHVPPEAILFLDDREENIEAARACGMVAMQYSNHAAFLSEMHRLGLRWLLSSGDETA